MYAGGPFLGWLLATPTPLTLSPALRADSAVSGCSKRGRGAIRMALLPRAAR